MKNLAILTLCLTATAGLTCKIECLKPLANGMVKIEINEKHKTADLWINDDKIALKCEGSLPFSISCTAYNMNSVYAVIVGENQDGSLIAAVATGTSGNIADPYQMECFKKSED